MNTIRLDKIENVKAISEFTIRDRVWFTYYELGWDWVRVIDKLTGAGLPSNVNDEPDAKAFLSKISTDDFDAAIRRAEKWLKNNGFEIPINKELSK